MRGLDTVYSIGRLDVGGVLSTSGWGTPIYGQLEAPVDFGLVLIPMYGSVIVLGAWSVIKRLLRRGLGPLDPVLAVASCTVAFTILVGAVAELGEQARFRTMTDPIVTVVVIALVVRRQSHARSVGR
jgi:hypothetical protein